MFQSLVAMKKIVSETFLKTAGAEHVVGARGQLDPNQCLLVKYL